MITIFPKPDYKRRKPKQKGRGEITKAQRQLALDWFGDSCTNCNGYPIELHHVVFRSQGGRGGYRNLMPLCKTCHIKAHTDRQFADYLREMRMEAFGQHFFQDMYDLEELGFIENATELQFENFMRNEERKC